VLSLALTALLAIPAAPALPSRVQRIVLHVLGGPSYAADERRFVFYDPPRTQALWRRPSFGAHWIVWTDGSLWPRHAPPGTPRYWMPDTARPADAQTRALLASEARPVYSHLFRGNSSSVGIEVAHSGRSDAPFPEAQARTAAWLLATLLDMSGGRLTERSVFGHKDLDQRPAYVRGRCERPGCLVFVDDAGRPFRRRVDPPEGLFATLARYGLSVPRPDGADAELERAERMVAGGMRPAVSR
jgi:N-acetyl-anhydromuramyl-L-alanine amidase AmpD